MSQMLFEHQEKDQQVSNQSQEPNLNNPREFHMHAQLSVSPYNQTENHEKKVFRIKRNKKLIKHSFFKNSTKQ